MEQARTNKANFEICTSTQWVRVRPSTKSSGYCLSTCWAPAVCPAVNKWAPPLSPLPSPPSLGPQCLKPILPLCTMTVWPQLWYPALGFASLMTSCGLMEDAGHHLCTSESWVQPECRRPCLSLVWSMRSNRVAGHCVCTLESGCHLNTEAHVPVIRVTLQYLEYYCG